MTQAMTASSKDPYVRLLSDTEAEAELHVPTMHCAACISKVERGMPEFEGVNYARANLSTKRVKVRFNPQLVSLDDVIADFDQVGFKASPFNSEKADVEGDKTAKELLIALAVAGFASANIMLFSVSVWSGGEMAEETRSLFHWISAIIAILAIAYSGRPFFRSALTALKAGGVNMDVPIALAVVLSVIASIYESYRGGELVYFEAGIMLLFFLLIGRYLDQRMRSKASDAAQNLLALKAVPATVIGEDGSQTTVPSEQVETGATVLVQTGMRLPVDGEIIKGVSDIDTSLVTGETVPVKAEVGDKVFAGTLNISAPLHVRVEGRGEDTFLAEIVRLMEVAEQGRSAFVRLADRLARSYAPVVHVLAAATFLGWWWYADDPHMALMRAVAVLIITCPCALGLAVPVVQVVASGRLLSAGILVKSEDGLERMGNVDTVVFDKTGTLTLGEMTLINGADIASRDLLMAAAIGVTSRHPLAQAVANAAGKRRIPMMDSVSEIPGSGLVGELKGKTLKLGSREHVGHVTPDAATGPELWLRIDDAAPIQFRFSDQLRPDAADVVAGLKKSGKRVILVSGDRKETVERVATEAGIDEWYGDRRPDDKIEILEKLKEDGATILMVGDGLNDAPALRAAHVSLSPSSATDVTQTASDFVFQGKSLTAVSEVLTVTHKTRRLVLENFALALGYNVIAVPLAVLGFVTPLVAAIAMSASSIVVTANALRLKMGAAK
ncbi:copper-translocating P-type ATPase [Kordiimonas sediminis]|uniref:Copper-translocating P-type ATPase n=1 Tax=Kordiimonas sediminis TaxID=1735581 RepID=A0A919E7C6_9PROT|nr:heavy metal translocating P-type ATPase [Kordiimonas sediminis]GHF19561.1 copper-translocating P-type ATPase [Kordiimonas sediminis]